MKKILSDNRASAVPLLLFIITIFSLGALYTLLFLEVALPSLQSYISDGPAKEFIIMMIYGIPGIILFIGGIALIKEGLKREVIY